jgi:alpha-mannosidase
MRMFFTEEKLKKQIAVIRSAIHKQSQEISEFKIFNGDCPGAEKEDFDDSQWDLFQIGERWGGYDQIAWFRTRIPIPEDWRNQKLVIRILTGPRDGYGSAAESQLYVNGFPLQALDVWHEEAWLPLEYASLKKLKIALRSWSGMYQIPPQRRMAEARLIRIDEDAETFYYLADTILKLILVLNEHDYKRALLTNCLDKALQQVNFFELKSPEFYHSIRAALDILQQGLAELQIDELKPKVNAIGHSHIDMAWMWRSQHTREKARRTFSTVLNLMRQYPEYQYIHTSPQLYKFVKQDDPELFERIKEKVAEGRWEPNGGVWVECDTNIPTGESLVRQFLYGKRFFKQEFGIDSKVLWLPDTFGFSWAIPQIMKKSGMSYFACSCIHWSKYNRFPHDTFYWRGLDGSEVLVTFFTAPGETIRNHYNYNGLIAPYDVQVAWEHYREKRKNDELLMPFGWGDGGGGPTREMLESIRAQANLPGHPSVKIGRVESYFERLESRLKQEKVMVWDGEIFQENLQGVYTSQARNKRLNRLSEILIHDAEWFNSLSCTLKPDTDYPQKEINENWEKILHLQFHDVLPGTSIHAVVEDSMQDYAVIDHAGSGLRDNALRSIAEEIQSEIDALVIFNSIPWQRREIVKIPWTPQIAAKTILDSEGTPQLMQEIEEDGEKKILLECDQLPVWGYRTFPWVSKKINSPDSELRAKLDLMENQYYRIQFNPIGQITSLFDKQRQFESIPPGEKGNVLQVFEDRPFNGEAWVIDPYYQDKMTVIDHLLSSEVEESGPIRAVIRFTWQFSDSTITQWVTLYRNNPRIDFRTCLDWHQHQMLLKAAFPLNIRATSATYEIQFGNIQRPTHQNTPIDVPHFENPAQKWVDLSEGDYGVALLNDCKYGYDVKDNVMRLTLHRSPTEPDPQADQGMHYLTYSLLPHEGTWRNSIVAEQAYALNYPLHTALVSANTSGSLPSQLSWATIDCDHVILETLKKAEDESAWIIRLYEYKQYRNERVSLHFWQDIKRAVEVDLMEENEEQLEFDHNRVTFSIHPYEIKSIKVWF